MDNSQKEKELVEKSKNKMSANRFIYTFIFLILLVVIAWGSYILKLDSGITYILIVLLIVIFYSWLNFFERNEIKEYVKIQLKKRYSEIKEIKTKRNELISGKIYRLDSIRKNNIYSFFIPKYSCYLNNYYEERFERISSLTQEGRTVISYQYIKYKNIVEYCYNLKLLGFDNVSNEIFNQSTVQAAIKKISNDKIIDVLVENNFLIVKKETVFRDYSKENANNDILDIETVFYEIVKLIK